MGILDKNGLKKRSELDYPAFFQFPVSIPPENTKKLLNMIFSDVFEGVKWEEIG